MGGSAAQAPLINVKPVAHVHTADAPEPTSVPPTQDVLLICVQTPLTYAMPAVQFVLHTPSTIELPDAHCGGVGWQMPLASFVYPVAQAPELRHTPSLSIIAGGVHFGVLPLMQLATPSNVVPGGHVTVPMH